MGTLNRPQIQTLQQRVVDGDIDFVDYVDAMGLTPPSVQIQLKAALEQRRVAGWTQDQYEYLRDEVRAEFQLVFENQRTEVAPPPRIFNPLANEGEIRIPDGLQVTVLPSSMGSAEKRKGSDTDPSDPVRTKSGRFLADVGEVWFVSPTTGKIKRRVFVSKGDMIAEAFMFARAISDQHPGAALVKFRSGNLKGNRHVLICDADGYIVTPQTIVDWHGRNPTSKRVGEKCAKLSTKVLSAMLAQNAEVRRQFGVTTDEHGTLKVCGSLSLDYPCVEDADPKEVEYQLRFVSGDTRSLAIRPRTDRKDDEGEVTLAGHRKRAFELLLETEGVGADQPQTVKYQFDGKWHIVSRHEAIEFVREDEEDEDPAIGALHAAFIEGHMDREEYETRAGQYAETLAIRAWEDDNPGKSDAQARWQGQLTVAVATGCISEDSFEYMQNWSHPSHRVNRPGPTMWQRKTRVDYHKDGTMCWQRAKNDNSPGARWIGGQSTHEAMVYNL